MMMWWAPEPLVQQYQGTDAEFIKVNLPPETTECVDDRAYDECADSWSERVGGPQAVCQSSATPLQKLFAGSLYDAIMSLDIPQAIRSPAYDMLKRFRIRQLQLDELFRLWQTEESPWEAVCKWATENMDFLNSTIPHSYPRVPREMKGSTFSHVTTGLGCLTLLFVLIAACKISREQAKPAIQIAQIGFLRLLLCGSFFIAIGAILSGLPSSNGTCIATIWFINVGYTLELVPLIVKVAAVNKLHSAASRMRRVQLSRQELYGYVTVICFLCVVYLVFWTVFDTPKSNKENTLTESITDDGEWVVEVGHYCGGNYDYWQYVAAGKPQKMPDKYRLDATVVLTSNHFGHSTTSRMECWASPMCLCLGLSDPEYYRVPQRVTYTRSTSLFPLRFCGSEVCYVPSCWTTERVHCQPDA